MSKGTLRKIPPLNPEKKPPPRATPYGLTPDGKQLFKEVTRRTRTKESIDPATGEPRYRKNALTGELLHKIREPENYDKERIFYLESEGNNNVRKVDYKPPTKEELREAARRDRIEKMMPKLAEALVDEGVDPAEFVRNALGREVEVEQPDWDFEKDEDEDEEVIAEPEDNAVREVNLDEAKAELGNASDLVEEPVFDHFPEMKGPGVWDLSSGERITGATKIEAQVKEAAAQGFVDWEHPDAVEPEL